MLKTNLDFSKCWCHTCNPIDYSKPETIFMRLCPTCGNKRCPKATDHNLECTHSNEPNQEGSIYQYETTQTRSGN